MRAVVTNGTGKGIESPYYTMAGKTGTAQVADKGIKYTDGVYQGSFVGFFPADKPRYTICVVIRTAPHSNAYYGGTIAAPVFRMVADKIFASNIGAWKGPLDSPAKAGDRNLPGIRTSKRSNDVLLHAIGINLATGDMAPEMVSQVKTDSTKKIMIVKGQVYKGMVPDVKGMSLKDAIYLLEDQGLQVQIKGKGRVQEQSIVPGSKIIKGQNILLQLS
jgi:cell division protein FtsI (penicillin-binding protein 3)